MTLTSPSVWLKILIAIGAIAMLFILFFPLIARSQFAAEDRRHDGCARGQRVDCEPSVYWMMRGWGTVASTR